MIRLCLAVATLHVRQDAFEGVATRDRIATIVYIVKIDYIFAASPENEALVFLGKLLKGSLDSEAVVGCQGGEHLKIVDVATVPATNRAFGECQGLVGNDAALVEKLLYPQAITGGAGAGWVIEGE